MGGEAIIQKVGFLNTVVGEVICDEPYIIF